MNTRYSKIIILAALGLTACKNVAQKVEPQQVESDSTAVIQSEHYADNGAVIYDEEGRRIYLVTESDLVSCYFQEGNDPPKKVIFGHEYGNDGFPIIYYHRFGGVIYLVGDFVPNSNGWTIRFPVYKVDAKTFDMSFIADGAAVNFGKDGFKIAQCRLTNPDADCTADEVWVMHNSYYDINGKKVRQDNSEYGYDAMEKEYGDSLVNARKMSIMDYE